MRQYASTDTPGRSQIEVFHIVSLPDRVATLLTTRTRLAILVMVVLITVLAAGVPMVESVSTLEQFQGESPEADAFNYVEANFTVAENETTSAQVIVRGENVLSQESLVAQLRYQEQLSENDRISDTLAGDHPMTGVANRIATAVYGQQQATQPAPSDATVPESQGNQQQSPSLADQRQAIATASDQELQTAIEQVLGGTGDAPPGGSALGLMPTDYTPGSTQADATVMTIIQHREADPGAGEFASPAVREAQLEMRTLGEADDDLEYLVFGTGILAHEIDASMADSLLIVAPLALAFVLLALAVGYRDLLDIVLGIVGITLVLVMTFGMMGWLDIAFGQVFVAVPVLLIGLSIDFAIHIFMRHREERETTGNLRAAMGISLAGVGVALVLVTATTSIGFLANVTSAVPPIREFGLVSALGIVAALLVFAILIPALKIELDEWLETRGLDRRKRAFGTGGGRFSHALEGGAVAARRAPVVVLVLVLLLGGATAAAGTQVDTSFDQRDFLADDPPDWMKSLPGPFATDSYTAKSTLDILQDRFVRPGETTTVLIRGEVTEPRALERIESARTVAADRETTQHLPDGTPAVDDPVTLMRVVALENESFAATLADADTNGDGIPDRNVAAVYDHLLEVAPDRAEQYIHRTDDGEYRALRVVIGVQGGANEATVTEDARAVATAIDGEGLSATATGTIILNWIVQEQLLQTVMESLVVTLVLVSAFLVGAYRLRRGSALLGLATLAPVALAAAWILGSMWLLSIPFNVMTGMILSLTIGIGVAYSIHVTERFLLELDRQGALWPAMHTAVTGTGGALSGSAATTVGGFGVLVFAILPPLQQFGIITGLSIVFAFVASVLVLPTLLALWVRFAGPDVPAGDPGMTGSGSSGARTASNTESKDNTGLDTQTDMTAESATESTASERPGGDNDS